VKALALPDAVVPGLLRARLHVWQWGGGASSLWEARRKMKAKSP